MRRTAPHARAIPLNFFSVLARVRFCARSANGFVREVDQKTSNKTIQLCGLTPDQSATLSTERLFFFTARPVLKVSSRAIDFYLYQTDLAREHERGTTHQRERELQRECDEHKERIVQFENDLNTLSHQVSRLQDAHDKARAELADSAQKLEEKSRQKRKLYEMYTALKQKAENQGLLFSPSSSHRTSVYDPPPPPVMQALPPQPPPPQLPPSPLPLPARFAAPSGASASVDDSLLRPSLRAAAAAVTEQRRVKSPRLSLGHDSASATVRRFDSECAALR